MLLGVPVLFDIYITKKVHWAFWKKKGVEKQSKTVEWVDALIFCDNRGDIDSYVLFRGLHDPDLFHGEIHAGGRLSFS